MTPEYKTIDVCRECERELGFYGVVGTNCCPYCGYYHRLRHYKDMQVVRHVGWRWLFGLIPYRYRTEWMPLEEGR